MKIYFLILSVVLWGCSTTKENVAVDSAVTETTESAESAQLKNVYYFEHRLIPKWIFESEGAFFDDMQKGNLGKLISKATELVSAEFANKITITPIKNSEAILIKFPVPETPPHCYYAILEKNSDGYRYITYEQTIDLGDSGFVGVVGGWDKDGAHSNYGPRKYKSSSSFVKDVIGREVNE